MTDNNPDTMDYETRSGQIRYNPETLDQLGMIEHDGIVFIYNRMDGVLQIENEYHRLVSELEELADEWEDFVGQSWDDYSSGVNDATESCARELRELLHEYTEQDQ
jgi:hypothetical protein